MPQLPVSKGNAAAGILLLSGHPEFAEDTFQTSVYSTHTHIQTEEMKSANISNEAQSKRTNDVVCH